MHRRHSTYAHASTTDTLVLSIVSSRAPLPTRPRDVMPLVWPESQSLDCAPARNCLARLCRRGDLRVSEDTRTGGVFRGDGGRGYLPARRGA